MNNILKDFRSFALDKTKVRPSVLDDQIRNVNNSITPIILEERKLNVTGMDVYSRMLLDRLIFFQGVVDDESCNTVIAQMLYLSSINSESDISLYLNTPGGDVVSGLSLVDTMKFIKPKVSTTCLGMAASMGAIILSCGEKGKRMILQHGRVMVHQVSGGFKGTTKDAEIEYEQMTRCKKDIYTILSENTGKSYEEIESLCDRDHWYIGKEAVEDLHICDKVLG